MDWYENVNFYEIRLINDKLKVWYTPLSFEDAKKEINNEPFIRMGYGEELHTRVIESIKDVTVETRAMYKKKYTAKRLKIGLAKE